MKTKHEENIKTTSEISEMKGFYLAERLFRKWTEDFVDEDNGEVVTIERREIILEKGTLLDVNNLTEINFLLQSGDITEVSVSDQKRECKIHIRYVSLWAVNIDLSGKGKNIYLYANSIDTAIKVASDYAEQAYKGYYSIKGAKEIGYGNLLTQEVEEETEDEDEKEDEVYKIEIEITEKDEASKNIFILKACDAENAKSKVGSYITFLRVKEEKEVDFELKIISAKTIPCNYIIEPEFSKKYIEIDKELAEEQKKELEQEKEKED